MQNIQRQSVIKSNFTGNDIELEFKHLYQFINSIQGSKSITFKGGKIDTVEPLHSEGVPNFKGLKLGKVKKNDFDLTVQDTFTFANEGYIKGYDGRGFFIGFDDFDNYTSTLFEMDNCVIRGSLFARQFVIDTYKYRAGNEIQGAGGGIVRNTDRSTWFELEDMTGNTGVFCEVNDVVMCQEVDRKGVTYDVNGDVVDDSYLIKRLTYKVSSISGNKCYLTSVTGAPGNKGTISKGDEFAVLYNETDATRQNIIGYMNNVKYAPYIFMKSGISNWTGWSATNNVDLVLGRLDWFTDADFGTLSGFGLFCDNVYLKGHISLANNGYINLGKTAYNDTTNGGFWIGDSDATATVNPYFYLGTASDTKYMKIDTTAGTFNTLGFEISAGAIKSTSTMTYDRGIAKTEAGYWLGKYAASDYRLFFGKSTSYMYYNSTNGFNVYGGTITGGTIQTDTSNKRVVMDGSNNWIKFFDSSGGDCGYIHGATGDLNLYADLSIVMSVANDNIELNAAKVVSIGGGGYSLYAGAYAGGVGISNGANSILFTVPSANLLAMYGGFKSLDSYIDAYSGFRVNGAATSGYYLRGNGTACVLSTIQAADLPDLSSTYIKWYGEVSSDPASPVTGGMWFNYAASKVRIKTSGGVIDLN